MEESLRVFDYGNFTHIEITIIIQNIIYLIENLLLLNFIVH